MGYYHPDDMAAGEILAAMFAPIPYKVRAGVWHGVMANDAGVLFDNLHGQYLGGECGWVGDYHKTRAACAAALATGERPNRRESREFLAACFSVCEQLRRGA